jgi:tetratricopeptide (TPR) repeat protein
MKRLLRVTLAVYLMLTLSSHVSSAFAFRNISPGDKAPDFTLSDAGGKSASLSAYGEKVVLLVLWGTDTESKMERSEELLKAVEAVSGRYADQGVAALSINFDKEGKDKAAEVAKKTGVTFPVLFDDGDEVYGSYGIFMLPTVGIIDNGGNLVTAIGYTGDIEKVVDGEVKILLGLATREELEAESTSKEVVEKPKALQEADRHMSLGRKMLDKRLYDQARAEFEAAAKLDPQRAEAFIELGLVLVIGGKYDEAMAQLTKGLEIEPESAQAHAGMGLVFFHQDQMDDAIDELEWALEINPRNPEIHYQLGLAYEKGGDKQEALKLYKSALKLVFKE